MGIGAFAKANFVFSLKDYYRETCLSVCVQVVTVMIPVTCLLQFPYAVGFTATAKRS